MAGTRNPFPQFSAKSVKAIAETVSAVRNQASDNIGTMAGRPQAGNWFLALIGTATVQTGGYWTYTFDEVAPVAGSLTGAFAPLPTNIGRHGTGSTDSGGNGQYARELGSLQPYAPPAAVGANTMSDIGVSRQCPPGTIVLMNQVGVPGAPASPAYWFVRDVPPGYVVVSIGSALSGEGTYNGTILSFNGGDPSVIVYRPRA